MPDDRVNRTLDALVKEAYELALKRGLAISKPEGWKRWKRATYADTARREGPGYLRHHYERLGLGASARVTVACAACGEPVLGNPYKDDDDRDCCSSACAGIRTMTLNEYLATLEPERRADFEKFLRRGQEGAA